MREELIAFKDLFGSLFNLQNELERVLCCNKGLVRLFIDNKTLLEVVSKGAETSEKRLTFDFVSFGKGFSIERLLRVALYVQGLVSQFIQQKYGSILVAGSFRYWKT